MADISLQREHDLSTTEVRSRLEQLAQKLADRIGGEWCWEGDTIVCDSRGAQARVGYDERVVSIEVLLPRVMRPLRGRVESKIDEVFERYFCHDSPVSRS